MKSFKFHEFLARVEEFFVGKNLAKITLLVGYTDEVDTTKIHMSCAPPIPKDKEEEVVQRLMAIDLIDSLHQIYDNAKSEQIQRLMVSGLATIIIKGIAKTHPEMLAAMEKIIDENPPLSEITKH